MQNELRNRLENWPVIFQAYAQADTRKAVIQLINSFGPFLAIWAIMYWTTFYSYLLTFALAGINAFFLVRIFIIQHDCGHRSFLKSQNANKVIGWICSFFSTLPYTYWAGVHNFHHGHSGQLEMSIRDIGDLKTLTVKEFREASPMRRLRYRIFRMPLITFVGAPAIYLGLYNRIPLVGFQGWRKIHRQFHLNNFALLAFYLLLGWLLGWQRFFFIQLSIVFLFGVIAMWFFYVQHQHEETYKEWKDRWEYLIAAVQGSTYYKLPRFLQWLTGNIGFHHIHHLNSKIPNYNLERAAKENEYLDQFVTTVTFFESFKYVKHKLWCEDTRRMISFREFYRREKNTQVGDSNI
jgi:acyl-lipid omega-6 desaturase (Delta-12 desaturase)